MPYEVARSTGTFKNHGLDVELVYTRGGSAAMQALIGGAVDYAATSLDVAHARPTPMSAPTSAALPSPAGCRCSRWSPRRRPRTRSHASRISKARPSAYPALGNADHALTLYLLKQADADASKVQFATMGVNLLEALRQGQIDAGLVQEPALTLLQKIRRARAGQRAWI